MNDMSLSISAARHAWRRHRVSLEAAGQRSTRWGIVARSAVSPLSKLAEPVLALLGLGRRIRANILALEITQIDVRLRNLPAEFDGYTILQLSDLHVGRVPGLIGRAAERVTGMSVDLVVMTGDFQTWGTPSAKEAASEAALFVEAVQARDGFIAVLGNHDRHDLVEHLEARGMRLLINEHETIYRGDARLQLTGLDDVNNFYTADAVRVLGERSADTVSIALVHSPELADVAADAGYALYLSGHTHGGQICLPGGKPIFTALDSHRTLASGLWRCGGMAGYTSRGIGVGRRARINCPPEIVRLRLRRG
jgi:predicted MPP superfamily phosphohydrolase